MLQSSRCDDERLRLLAVLGSSLRQISITHQKAEVHYLTNVESCDEVAHGMTIHQPLGGNRLLTDLTLWWQLEREMLADSFGNLLFLCTELLQTSIRDKNAQLSTGGLEFLQSRRHLLGLHSCLLSSEQGSC